MNGITKKVLQIVLGGKNKLSVKSLMDQACVIFVAIAGGSNNVKNRNLTQEQRYFYEVLFNKLSEPYQILAVRQCGYAIQYCINPSEEVQLMAVMRHPPGIKYINNPSEEVQLTAVRIEGYVIEYIQFPTDRVRLVATNQLDTEQEVNLWKA